MRNLTYSKEIYIRLGERCRKTTSFMILEQGTETGSIVPTPPGWICFGMCNWRASSVGVERSKVSCIVHDYRISQRAAAGDLCR